MAELCEGKTSNVAASTSVSWVQKEKVFLCQVLSQ